MFPPLEQSGFHVHLQTDRSLPAVLGDRQALFRCVQNLISNAAKYSGNSRNIHVQAALDEVRDEITISVKDEGIGIDPAEVDDIFEPFYRSSRAISAQIHGTGLGLSVVKHIVESMGGRISVTSTLGTGSVFSLHLPIAAQARRDAELVHSETSA
jgi:signal transduction histidine kinase